jgi:hypothetical protein
MLSLPAYLTFGYQKSAASDWMFSALLNGFIQFIIILPSLFVFIVVIILVKKKHQKVIDYSQIR